MNCLGNRHLFCCLAILFLLTACGGEKIESRTMPPATGHGTGDQHALTAPAEPADAVTEPEATDAEALREAGLQAMVDDAPGDRGNRPEFVALVNGENVPFAYLEQRLASMHSGQLEDRRSAYDLERLMFKVVNDVLLSQEARAVGLDQEEPVKGQVDRYREDLVIAALEREQIDLKSKAGEEEIRRIFEDQYRRITLRVVTVDEEEDALRLLEEIRAGADMAALAAERSVDPYSARGGIVEGVARRDLASEVGALASTLEPGGLGGPVITDLGWSVIRLEAIEDADEAKFEAARPQLAGIVELEKKKVLRAALAQRVQQTHPVQMERERIASIEPERLADGRLVPRTGDPGDVVVTVGDSLVITAGEYAEALMLRWSGVRSEDAARAAAPIILNKVIERKLMLAEATSGGYAARPEVAARVRAYESQLLVSRYLEKVVAADVEVTAEEMQAAYEKNRRQLKRPPRLNLGQITVEEKPLADEIVRLLREGTDLAWLARKHSTDRFADSGGVRGWMVPSPGVDDIQDRLLEAQTGDVLDPVGVPGNYYVLKVMAREEQGVYDLAEVSGNIRNMVFSEKFRVVLDEFITTLRSRSEIRINKEALASISISGAVDDVPAAGEGGSPHAH
jgi:parvulin-like peptidyl-prolyl isomerase